MKNEGPCVTYQFLQAFFFPLLGPQPYETKQKRSYQKRNLKVHYMYMSKLNSLPRVSFGLVGACIAMGGAQLQKQAVTKVTLSQPTKQLPH